MTPHSFFVLLRNRSGRRRSGVSPVIATTIVLAITIVLGLSLWSFANSGVSTATATYAQVVTEYGRFTSDRFVIANMDFDNPSANNVAFWIYNSGKLETTIGDVTLTCKDCSPAFAPIPTSLTQQNPDDVAKPLTMGSKSIKKFYFDTQTVLEAGKTYELTVISDTGASYTYIKRSD